MITSVKKMCLAAMALTLGVSCAFAQEYSEKEMNSPVSRARAQEIALQKVQGGKVIESEFNEHWFRDNDYEFTVVDERNRYDVRVDAKNGQVIDVKQKPIYVDSVSDGDNADLPASAITPARARAIAMERAPSAAITEMERDSESTGVVYAIEMMSPTSKINMKVDASTGKILSFDEERADNNMPRNNANAATNRALNNAQGRAAEIGNAADRATNSAVNAANSVDRAIDNAANRAVNAANSAVNTADRAANTATNRAVNAANNAVNAADRSINNIEGRASDARQAADRALDKIESNAAEARSALDRAAGTTVNRSTSTNTVR